MYLNTLDVTLAQRTNVEPYNLRINPSTIEILSLLLEFKVATSWHISRFLTGKDQSKYIYAKLRRMWKAGLLESFKVYSGSLAGVPVFYMLSKSGLKILEEKGSYNPEAIRLYPHARTLLSWGLFKHEAQVVELASLEVKNKANNFDVSFQGEATSLGRNLLSNKNIEVLTPDYTVWYKIGDIKQCIYSEFERTIKSKEAALKKIERYINFLSPEERKDKTLRLIFQTPNMEQSFWGNILANGSTMLQKLNILTTNLTLIKDHGHFLQPIYLSDRTVKLAQSGIIKVDMSNRIKLFSFL